MGNYYFKGFSIRGYVIDKERLKNGTFLNEEYFDHLIEEIMASEPHRRQLKVTALLTVYTINNLFCLILTFYKNEIFFNIQYYCSTLSLFSYFTHSIRFK